MTEQQAAVTVPDRAAPAAEGQPGHAGDATLVDTELLVEEVSIDGMCGVY